MRQEERFGKIWPRSNLYQGAIALLNSRRRKRRPTSEERLDLSKTPGFVSMPNGVPSLKGMPSLTGIREWLKQLGHSVFLKSFRLPKNITEQKYRIST